MNQQWNDIIIGLIEEGTPLLLIGLVGYFLWRIFA
jgi:hypothetical protein